MIFENWYEKIKNNSDNFIEYYVNQFGEENRTLITERFDSLKFCFYIDPNYIKDWISLQLRDDYQIATYNFLKEVGSSFGIDSSKLLLEYNQEYEYIFINSTDENFDDILRRIFSGGIALSGMSDDYLFFDLYSFRSLEDFVKGEGKEYDNPEKELLHRRLLFLNEMKDIFIDGIPIDYFDSEECKKFINSSRYQELINKYCTLAQTAFKYKKSVDSKYKNLIDYMKKSIKTEKEIISKYDKLKKEANNLNEIEEYDRACKKEIASSRIVCGNFDITNCSNEDEVLDIIIDGGDMQVSSFGFDALNQEERIIFFCPFKSMPGYEDVDLRHEIRHGITSSASTHDNETTYKIGNKIDRFIGNELVECDCLDWNEWVTQIEAKKETKNSFANQIYIVSKPSIRNQNFIGKSSDYDDYLSLFEIIYNAISTQITKSQIELSNDSLYSIIPLEEIIDIENMILNADRYNSEIVDKLHTISNHLIDNLTSNNGVVKK